MAQNFDLASLLVSSSQSTARPEQQLRLPAQSAIRRASRFLAERAPAVVQRQLPNRGQSASPRHLGPPILLGNIRLLNGDMDFRGNHYRLSRGDINFVNPFRLDPVMNIEATATIQNYEVTLDFTGPPAT